ncbi:MAG: hypothetical protein IT210_03835 [Armatimonadetes bacterium]|nr:hypothetical protein [Armatimonadota bacterium]
MAQDIVAHEAQNEDPNPGPVGKKPYEMAGRQEERVPLIDFQDVSGWEVEGQDAEGWLYRSQEQKLFRDYCGKLVYMGKGANPVLTVRPKKPIPIPDPWDNVNFWNYGNSWGWAPDPTTPFLQVSAVIHDAAGAEIEMPLGGIDYQYWFLMNGRLHAEEMKPPKRPLSLAGFRFRNAHNREKRTVYLGPCYFFMEDLKPLIFEPWPAKLPFPTRAATILPENKTREFTNSVRQTGQSVMFAYKGKDCSLGYRYTPVTGTLGDIEVIYRDKAIRPCAEGGMRLVVSGESLSAADPSVRHTLVEQKLSPQGMLRAVWRLEKGEVSTTIEYRLKIRQKSLVVEMQAADPVISHVALGRAEPVRDGRIFWIPYLTYGGNDPRALYAGGLFFFNQFDWYYSDASTLYGGASVGADYVVYNGGAEYIPKTDGKRNVVRERLFITASPDFQEVLPTIANPKSPMRQAQGDRLWRVKGGADIPAEIAEASKLRKYGVERVSIRYHEDSWRDAGESFTFRTEAAPGRGGDAALKRFVSTVQSLGWRVGLYTNYTDYAPVNQYWNEDWVSRRPNGDWTRAWMRCYAPKPMRSVEMEDKLAPRIQAKFGENHSYCDVHTAVTPFERVDYDARVPGAGTFRRTFECFGRLLYNEKFAHKGPVYSEGNNHWWYSGLTDGNYAQIISGSPPKEPLLVDFDLLKMHPLQMDAGMGAPGMFFRGSPPHLDQFIATSMAYGHIGFVDWDNLEGMLKIYYMMQRAQSHYAMIPVARIEYDHNGRMIDTSKALVSGAYLKSRVHVAYRNGMEVFVNGSPESWTVSGPDRQFELPAWGYLAFRKGHNLLAYSAVVPAGGPEGRHGPRQRADMSLADGQHYADSRGGFAFLGPIALEGSAALKKEGSAWWVIPATRVSDFAFSPDLLNLKSSQSVNVAAFAEDGSRLGSPALRWSRGMPHILPGENAAFKYRVTKSARPRPAALACKSALAPVGESLAVTVPANTTVRAGKVFWEVGGQRRPAEGTISGKKLICRVPADAEPGQHLWLGVPIASETLWIDFLTVSAFDLSLRAPSEAKLAQGQPLQAVLSVSNNLERDAAVQVRLNASEGVSLDPSFAEVAVKGGQRAEVPIKIGLPWQAGPVEAQASGSFNGVTASSGVRLAVDWLYPVMLDLTDRQVAYIKGYCPRGGEETIGGREAHEGSFEPSRGVSGGIEKACLFSHPPYSPSKPGYAFAVYDVEIPTGAAASLDFAMGMRDGLDATDGVTYKVVVADAGGRAHEVFSRHYKEVRWEEARADLAPFAGQKIKLKLIADCGPADDTSADHALWGDVRVVIHGGHLRQLSVRQGR